MTRSHRHLVRRCAAALLCLSAVMVRADEPADDEFTGPPTWRPPAATAVREQVFQWIATLPTAEKAQEQAAAVWPAGETDLTGEPLLERTVKTLAAADERARELVDYCNRPRKALVPPSFAFLHDDKVDPVLRNNLRLWFGRWLGRERLYDEAQRQLAGLTPTDVADPASLLFYQAVNYHWLLDRDNGLQTLETLLQGRKDLPRRYETMARLMQADLKGLKDDSLDHISRRMDDVKRRLDFGRTGKTVRGIEDGVIASLDKLIKELEDEEQKKDEASAASGKMRPMKPADDSRPSDLKGPGEVAKKNIGKTAGWGDLPPKQREEALQQIGEEFPSHYREIIEQYFRELASEEAEK